MKVYLLLVFVGVCAASEYVQFVEKVRQNYEEQINSQIVQQIGFELQASYLYQAYSHYFSRADVALPGFAKWFEKASKEERDHADSLINYINQRGGVVSLSDIYFNQACSKISDGLQEMFKNEGRETACICYFMSHKKDKLKGECVGLNRKGPDRSNWKNGLWAMQDTLVMERFVNDQLLKLHDSADNDPHLSHILEHEFLDEQVKAIKALGDYIRQLERVGTGLGEYTFDQKLE